MLKLIQNKEEKNSKQLAAKDYLNQRQEELKDSFEEIERYQLEEQFRHLVKTFQLVYGGLEDNEVDIETIYGPLVSPLF